MFPNIVHAMQPARVASSTLSHGIRRLAASVRRSSRCKVSKIGDNFVFVIMRELLLHAVARGLLCGVCHRMLAH